MHEWSGADDRRYSVLVAIGIYLVGFVSGGGLVGLIAWMV